MTAEIKPRPCAYNSGTKIYWNSSANAYWEVFANKRHVCPYRPTTNSTKVQKPVQPFYKQSQEPASDNSSKVQGPDYVKSKRSQKPRMDNSLEVLSRFSRLC